MTEALRSVTVDLRSDTERIPEMCSEGALIVQDLVASGRMAELGERLQIQREGGYTGLDVFVVLVYFYAAHMRLGIKRFYQRVRGCLAQLAGLANRRTLPTPASVSRALAAVDSGLEEFGTWLLYEAPEARPVLLHPAVLHRDGRGDGWHVFDFDPTRTVMRHRALPRRPDLPPARRRTHEARPGYQGRKRGHVQLSRSTLQHAGSGLWLGIWTAAGNGDFRRHAEKAARVVRQTCMAVAHDPGRALLRADGEGGNTPFITACQESGIRFLTRSAHYTLLDQPAIRRHLNEATWHEVEDSGSGPQRQATELGWFTLPCAPKTVRDDGTPYAPVQARLVVSRYSTDQSRGSGHLIADWKYEMYATDLLEGAWPAPEVVTTYYGRTGQENRFGQEDRELGLDRIVSYHLPGQHLANLVGLFVWNLQTCKGLPLLDVPDRLQKQLARQVVVAEAAPPLEVPPIREDVEEALPVDAEGEALPAAAESGLPVQPEPIEAQEQLDEVLATLDWTQLLDGRGDWTWKASTAELLCPNGSPATLTAVKLYRSSANGQMRFLVPLPACNGCPVRQVCTESSAPSFRKELGLTVPGSVATRVHELLAAIRGRLPSLTPRRPPLKDRQPQPPPQGVVATWRLSSASLPPKLAPRAAVLSPAVLRRAFCQTCVDVAIHVAVINSQSAKPSNPAIAYTAAERQHRRRTFAQRHSYNARKPDDVIHVRLETGSPNQLAQAFPSTA